MAKAVRVQDIGAYHYLLQENKVDLHLIIESGNHNLVAIKKWEQLGGDRLKRIVLGLGYQKILFLNTQRKSAFLVSFKCLENTSILLTTLSSSKPLNASSNDEVLKVSASSERNSHKGFCSRKQTWNLYVSP